MVESVGNSPSFTPTHLKSNVQNSSSTQASKSEAHENNKAEQIKKAIEEGNYKVDTEKTAHKVAQNLLG
ncbi:flagellar biosynthesis anti-sigma factor FlgM [Helicobacter suis]|uniref:flagellar biosynthesis anti-sigma factor FlgM n=1 Tax=Helicobacter suis TaxID=104628 RepID=UPI0013D431C5|nr:flagellar biosynthesis anti-sigma factor FlgM [Helicobacter suis]